MRPESNPVTFTVHLPSLPDEAVIEIEEFLYEILDLFQTHYGCQIKRYLEDYSFDNIIESDDTYASTDDPPF